jgi:hypothetical protein
MGDFEEKRHSGAQIALLAVFALGLALAYLMVRTRSGIGLAQVRQIPGSGLTLFMPSGAGWVCEQSWSFARNTYTVTSTYGQGRKEQAEFTAGFLVAADNISAQDQVRMRANQLGAATGSVRQYKIGGHTMLVSELEIPGVEALVLYGFVPLGEGRGVSIEVIDKTGSWGWTIAEAVIRKIVYSGNAALDAGAKLTASMKSERFAPWFKSKMAPKYYLISMNKQEAAGFAVSLEGSQNQSRFEYRFVDSYYINDNGGEESLLEANNALDQWVWIS